MVICRYTGNTICNIARAPVALLASAVALTATGVGVVGTALSIATLGELKEINRVASYSYSAKSILVSPYEVTIKVLNPDFQFDSWEQVNSGGVMSTRFAKPILGHAYVKSAASNFFTRHIVSRGAYLLGAIVSTISRIADLCLGLVAATISILPCFGRVSTLNHFAQRHLMALALIGDLCLSFRGIVNPQQFLPKPKVCMS